MRWDMEVQAAVNQAARLYGVTIEPALVHAVIERESAHRDTSAAGTLEPNMRRSYGPMQVMDTTAAMHGITDPKTLVTPSIGIRIGTFELARLLRLFPGDTPRAIAAYNAGPGNARRNAAGKFPNQSYVDAVLSFWARFKPLAVAASPAVGAIALLALVWFLMSRRRRARLAWG
jgi:soluble lytic murein transglycosylase-like protein